MVRIANAPCSWGVIEGIEGDGGGYRRVIDEIAETGYVGTELGDWGFMPTDPDKLRSELDARGLALVACHFLLKSLLHLGFGAYQYI